MSKMQVYTARTQRAIVKAVTGCGCIEICARTQRLTETDDITALTKAMDSHLKGVLCENCKSTIEREIGSTLYYITSIACALNLDMEDIIYHEINSLDTLGKYNLK